jgi:hypothetical protein
MLPEALDAYNRTIDLSPFDRNLWLEKSICLAELGPREDTCQPQKMVFEDQAFAERCHRQGLDRFERLSGLL